MRKGYRQCSKCGKNRQLKFYKTPRGRVCVTCQRRRTSYASRETRLWETYGITLEEYDAMLEVQGGSCAICYRKPRYNMDVDHDHAIERVFLEAGYNAVRAKYCSIRGLLCKPCNRRLLPSAKDDPSVLWSAIFYLEEPIAYQVLGAGLQHE